MENIHVVSYGNKILDAAIISKLNSTEETVKDDFSSFNESLDPNSNYEEKIEKDPNTDYVLQELGGDNVSFRSTSLGHLLSLIGLTVDLEELKNAETPAFAQVAFKANLEEIKNKKEAFREEYRAAINRLSEKSFDPKEDVIFGIAGLLLSSGSEIGRQAKLNKEISRLEIEYMQLWQ